MSPKRTAGAGRFAGKLWWWLILVACFSLSACGGARQQAESQPSENGEVDIDKLLNTPEQEKKQTAEEQEVLRLLGIATDETPPDSMQMDVAQAMAEKETAGDAPSEIERLQRELQDRDQQISILRNELATQERRLQELESSSVRKVKPGSGAQIRGVSVEFREGYERAMRFYNQHSYREALAAFSSLLAMDDKNSLSDNAQYWVGECYYGMGNYNQAVAEFQKVLSFTRSNKSDAALLKLGLCYIRLGDRSQARSELEQLIANFPKSEYVGKARTFLSRI